MKKRILFACDLEGMNNVVGEAYSGLSKSSEQWEIARRQAALEINAAAEALFEAGVISISLWDNHGGGGNIDPPDLDKRIELLAVDNSQPRMSFAKGRFDAICYFGYHAMEGTLGGVLAHTMNSKNNQYYKLNGRYIGEVDMDAYIAAEYEIPSVFFVGGDIACRQARRAVTQIVTVITKEELGRNKANFRENNELFAEIKAKIIEAVNTDFAPERLKLPSIMEKSYKRTEDAAKYLMRMRDAGISADHPDDDILGKDAHTVVSRINSIDEFIISI